MIKKAKILFISFFIILVAMFCVILLNKCDKTHSSYIKKIKNCIKKEFINEDTEYITSINELENTKVGVLTGSVFDTVLFSKVKTATPIYYNTTSDMLLSLLEGKISAMILDEPVARNLKNQVGKVAILYPALRNEEYGWIFSKDDTRLLKEIDKIITQYKKDGTLDEIDKTWFGKDESKKVLPDTLGENRKGKLKFSTNSTMPPFAYIKDNKIVGYEIDLINRIGKELGYEIEIYDQDFTAIIPSVVSHKTDLAGAIISITEERAKSVNFSQPTYFGGVVAVVESINTDSNQDLYKILKRSFKRTFIEEDRYKLIFEGLKLTMIISFFTILYGTILGIFICRLRRSKKAICKIPASIYIKVIQGIPVLILLMILFYIVFAKTQIDAVNVAIIAFTIDFSAYAAEIFRSGIDSIDKGQYETSRALGFNKMQTFIYIIIPQAIRHVLPVYRGEVISTIKMTSIVGYIAIQDLTKMTDIIRSRTYEAFFPLIATAVIYFILAYFTAEIIKYVEFKFNPLNRKRVIKGVEVK